MFKTCMIYRVPAGWTMDLDAMEAALAASPFTPCEGAQEKTYGWVPPRGEAHGRLVESINGHRIMRFAIETKSVPASAVKRTLEARAAKIEAEEGRKPGRRECRDLRDEIARGLLPHAFPKTSHILVWLNPATGYLVLDTASQSKADEVITALVRALTDIQIAPLNTELAPQTVMASWLMDGEKLDSVDRFCFDIGRHVELHSGDETRSVVKFDRHHLDDEQMRLHISQGKLPTQLALDWDGRVSFILTRSTQLKKVAFLDGVFGDDNTDEHADRFDADVAIATGELSALITDLVEALGGALS